MSRTTPRSSTSAMRNGGPMEPSAAPVIWRACGGRLPRPPSRTSRGSRTPSPGPTRSPSETGAFDAAGITGGLSGTETSAGGGNVGYGAASAVASAERGSGARATVAEEGMPVAEEGTAVAEEGSTPFGAGTDADLASPAPAGPQGLTG